MSDSCSPHRNACGSHAAESTHRWRSERPAWACRPRCRCIDQVTLQPIDFDENVLLEGSAPMAGRLTQAVGYSGQPPKVAGCVVPRDSGVIRWSPTNPGGRRRPCPGRACWPLWQATSDKAGCPKKLPGRIGSGVRGENEVERRVVPARPALPVNGLLPPEPSAIYGQGFRNYSPGRSRRYGSSWPPAP